MTTRQARWGRLDRLAGNGSSEAGIDLASLFRVILNQIQDSSAPVAEPALICAAQDAISNHARIEHWYGQFSDDPWHALLADALEQLEARRLIVASDEGWKIDPNGDFATGKRLVVVPARSRKNQSVGVTLYSAGERAARGEAEKRRMEITSLVASLRESGNGLRPLAPDHVDALAQSMRDFGYRREFPVLKDQHDRILDGRHRIAAARKAGISDDVSSRTITVSSDEEAVGLAILVNIQRGWTQAERNQINRTLQTAGLTMEGFGRALGTAAKRELIKTALLEDPDLSHRKIADWFGVSHRFVDSVCVDEVATVATSECRHGPTGQGARTDLPARQTTAGRPRLPRTTATPDLDKEMRRRARAGEPQEPAKQAADFGLSGRYPVQLSDQRAEGTLQGEQWTRAAVLALLDDHRRSDADIAVQVGCDEETVADARLDLEASGKIPQRAIGTVDAEQRFAEGHVREDGTRGHCATCTCWTDVLEPIDD